ncbi:hydrolase [Corynebacterium phocae]|uniref:Hydrolase n=1 Tax=Corynebacterium phocae TaxID=161895 RepID=A0A1L7D4N0_9CORY|nr:zinc-dependent metalloprotease [Corynebacterium phocae]APT93065.1 hydrolase [Corynebacterium phocae]KAA8722366.1 zinc-dependent metalloprotease [Corynebacterium phocae]
MSNGFGFGFNFPNNGDNGDKDRDGNNQDPFGGGLGDILGQFGAMLSGMGSSMNSPDNSGPINTEMATRLAKQRLGTPKSVGPEDAKAVEQSVRLVELWLNDSTALPASNNKVAAWNAADWLDNTLPMWSRLAGPVAEHANSAQLDSLPEEAREMMGPMAQMMKQFSGMNAAMQLGTSLGDLAKQALTGADFGLPVSPAGTTAVVTTNVQSIASSIDVPDQEVMVYIAAREAARQRLFTQVPWLVEHIVSSVEEYALGLEIDTSHIEEATRELNLESGDPQAIQDAMSRLQGMDLTPRVTSRNAGATARLETLLALVEGWVDVVVYEALKDRIKYTTELAAAWSRRTNSGGSADHALSRVVGIEITAPAVDTAAELWRRVTVAVGTEKRDKSWDHPDLLPDSEQLRNPASFIDGLLDDQPTDGFEEELAKLEEMLRSEDEEGKDS